MKKFAGVLFSAFMLAACSATSEDQRSDIQRVQSTLPEGCVLHYAGEVRVEGYRNDRPSRIFVTVCDNTVTTSETHSVHSGKTTVDENIVSVTTR